MTEKDILNKTVIKWEDYRPDSKMQAVIDHVNNTSEIDLREYLPPAVTNRGARASFDYTIHSQYEPEKVKKVYVLINGFAERADTSGSNIKGHIAELLIEEYDVHDFAIVVIGGLFAFPTKERNKILKKGSGALKIAAEEIAKFVELTFRSVQSVTVSGFSLGGVMAPLVAREILGQGIADIGQVCCGEPNYVDHPTTRLNLLKRVSRASAYRNDQIRATTIEHYIEAKKTPQTRAAMATYRTRLYGPLVRHSLSMRLVASELAIQAKTNPPESEDIQFSEALRYLASHRVKLTLLNAEHSIICQKLEFSELANELDKQSDTGTFHQILILGKKADHGVEEQRSLTTPLLVAPESLFNR